ncbi:hypothetical protein BJ970_005932 [Saccharopolyspora phatthalungensis]|uniref:Uncharacterized protein n=1 Tax=Saccharopolyspora phatthalungensis TaxID=664693 RepID=A0A840QJV4_9PSEU|nr:hypothetical protein [Saccharopolyspora phatthalungensis]
MLRARWVRCVFLSPGFLMRLAGWSLARVGGVSGWQVGCGAGMGVVEVDPMGGQGWAGLRSG